MALQLYNPTAAGVSNPVTSVFGGTDEISKV